MLFVRYRLKDDEAEHQSGGDGVYDPERLLRRHADERGKGRREDEQVRAGGEFAFAVAQEEQAMRARHGGADGVAVIRGDVVLRAGGGGRRFGGAFRGFFGERGGERVRAGGVLGGRLAQRDAEETDVGVSEPEPDAPAGGRRGGA